MLSNFCFHIYAQKSLFIGENDNGFFYLLILLTRSTDIRLIIFRVDSESAIKKFRKKQTFLRLVQYLS